MNWTKAAASGRGPRRYLDWVSACVATA